MKQNAADVAKMALGRRRATLSRVRASNDEGIEGLRTEKHGEELSENTEIAGALVALSERERIELAEIDAAIVRIENGSWGLCERCNEPIAAPRLNALPEARTCIEHAS